MNDYLRKMSIVPETSKLFTGSVVVGDVKIGNYCGIFYNSVIRGDSCSIRIGNNTNIQDNCVLHGDDGFDVNVGDNCVIAHSVVLHGCTIGNNTCVGIGAVVLNGAKIGNNCIVGAGSVVGSKINAPDGYLVIGNPAVIKRPLKKEELDRNEQLVKHYNSLLENFPLYNSERT